MPAHRIAGPAIDPDVFESVAGGASDLPERRLIAAVLFDAVLQLCRRGSAGAAEAARWIHDRDDDDTPFSFVSVCEALGLNAEYLARGLIAWNPDLRAAGIAIPSRRAFAVPRKRRVALPSRRKSSTAIIA
jgi:hypothetical protein